MHFFAEMLLLLFFSLKVEWLSVLNAMQLLPLPASYPVSPDDGENSDVLVHCYSLLLSGNIVSGQIAIGLPTVHF